MYEGGVIVEARHGVIEWGTVVVIDRLEERAPLASNAPGRTPPNEGESEHPLKAEQRGRQRPGGDTSCAQEERDRRDTCGRELQRIAARRGVSAGPVAEGRLKEDRGGEHQREPQNRPGEAPQPDRKPCQDQ